MPSAACAGTLRPNVLPVQVDQIPVSLKTHDQWVVWRLVEKAGASGWTKPPFNPKTGLHASTTNPTTWSSFGCAVEAFQLGNWDGLGFVVSPLDPLVGIDLDHCRNPETGLIETTVAEIVSEFASYTEVSPTGTGLRIWIFGSLDGLVPESKHGRKRGPIEVYDGYRFLTVTGQVLKEHGAIESRQAVLQAFVHRLFNQPEQPNPEQQRAQATDMPISLDDDTLIARAHAAANGHKFDALWRGDSAAYPSGSEADLALLGLLTFWSRDPDQLDRLLRRSGRMRSKWNRRDYRERTIAKALERVATFNVSSQHQRQRRVLSETRQLRPVIELKMAARHYGQ